MNCDDRRDWPADERKGKKKTTNKLQSEIDEEKLLRIDVCMNFNLTETTNAQRVQ